MKETGDKKVSLSFGFSCRSYEQVIVFIEECYFEESIAANPNMTAIMGGDDYTQKTFPGIYICGIKAS